MKKDDTLFLVHIIDVAGKIRQSLATRSRADFDANEELRDALAHRIQTIGEAASRLSTSFCDAHTDIPWPRIIGMRHRIVHDYMNVDYDIVWDVATVEVPRLVEQIARIVPPQAP